MNIGQSMILLLVDEPTRKTLPIEIFTFCGTLVKGSANKENSAFRDTNIGQSKELLLEDQPTGNPLPT
jgi:hypothetical protein